MKFEYKAIQTFCLGLWLLVGGVGVAHAQALDVDKAWVRTTVQGQRATGAFMQLTARERLQLVRASSPVAGVVEVHEMKMEGDVMRMAAVKEPLVIEPGQTLTLKPGGYHIMLMDLKAALPPDQRIPLTLVVRDARGRERALELQVPVRSATPQGAAMEHRH